RAYLIYQDRILRGTDQSGMYSVFELGAIGADLGAVACFFLAPWNLLAPNLPPSYQSWLLSSAAFRLSALGRLAEAAEPMRAALGRRIEENAWMNAAACADNLSDLELMLGEVSVAVADGEKAVAVAERSGFMPYMVSSRTEHANALHQAGHRD